MISGGNRHPWYLAAGSSSAYSASHRLNLTIPAAVLNREPAAITLRYLQTMVEVGTEKNTTLVFPLPIDLLGGLGARLGGEVKK